MKNKINNILNNKNNRINQTNRWDIDPWKEIGNSNLKLKDLTLYIIVLSPKMH